MVRARRERWATAGAWVAVACFAGLSGCFGTTPQSPVNVTVRGFSATAAAAFPGEQSVTVILFARPIVNNSDADVAETRRAIYWNRSDPFTFTVQLPAGRYGSLRVETRATVGCGPGGAMPRDLTFARGTIVSDRTLSGSAMDVEITLTPASIGGCP